VSLDYYVIDSWDGELVKVLVDGAVLTKEAFGYSRDQSNLCGGDFLDNGRVSVERTRAHSANTALLNVTSTLDQDAWDESFGINNVRVLIR
jgi:hypothetical protein